MKLHRILTGLILLSLLAVPVAALAQDAPGVSVTSVCQEATVKATFDVSGISGTAPFEFVWDFGDGEAQLDGGLADPTMIVDHTYGAAGEYAWSLLITDSSDPAVQTTLGGTVVIGPQVSLTSDPFPPLLPLIDSQASITLTASATSGEPPYAYAWDPEGDGIFEPGTDELTFAYSAGGKYQAAVQVTDDCGLTATATLPVLVDDPEAEACHPMAQRIADGINTLFPNQAGTLYTCEEIFGIKGGDLTGQVLGYGRLWHAYKLAQTMEDLTWEEILQWKLDGTGWGLLTQLDRVSETLADVGLRELFDIVVSGEASVGEIRTAVRAVTRYQADFYDALERAAGGANPGELGRIYRMADDLELDPSEIDAYLAEGISLSQLRQAARLAEQTGGDLESLTAAHAEGYSWGEIKQAMGLAGDEGDLDAVLEAGVRETRQAEQQERKQEREQERLQQQTEQQSRLATRLAARYRISVEQVQALADGACAGDWHCVQATLQETYGPAKGGRGGKK
ncbi:MAG TPA: PKD domain-containing protein [Anaerolineales bacterium]|nr:PKD domain-containing protein [Anaerolineales bacterium]